MPEQRAFRVVLQDELPHVGSGHRRVLAAVGSRKVRVVYPGNAAVRIITRRKWENLKPQALGAAATVRLLDMLASRRSSMDRAEPKLENNGDA